MPASVFAYTQSASLADTESEKQSILETFAEDFGKYARRADPDRLRKVFTRLPLLIGQRLKYAHIDRGRSGAQSGPCFVVAVQGPSRLARPPQCLQRRPAAGGNQRDCV